MMPVPIAPVMMPIFSFHWFFVSKKYRVRALSGCQPERQCSQTVVAQSCPVLEESNNLLISVYLKVTYYQSIQGIWSEQLREHTLCGITKRWISESTSDKEHMICAARGLCPRYSSRIPLWFDACA